MTPTRPPRNLNPLGLSAAEAGARLLRDGPNLLPGTTPRSLLAIIVGVLIEPMFLMLLVAGGLYLAWRRRRKKASA